MLIRLTDIKNLTHWINPIHVKMLRQKKGVTEVFITINPSWVSPTIKTRIPIDELADMLNAAMPEGVPFVPDDDHISGGQGASAAV